MTDITTTETSPKDTFFSPKRTLQCRGKIINLSVPLVMGILNIAPDSFYDGGFRKNMAEILAHTARMLNEGAGIIDIGAVSSRPGAALIPCDEELERLLPVLRILIKEFPDAIWSVDTCHSETARIAIDEGAHMINDISAGEIDRNMFDTIAALQVPYILMHMRGIPANMQQNPLYDDIVREVVDYFAQKTTQLKQRGVHDMIIDPGFGFGKSIEHNYMLLEQLNFFQIFDLPVMVGLSRKSMIYKVLGTDAAGALNGTTALHALALQKGAAILRVHDVRQAVEVVSLYQKYHEAATASERKNDPHPSKFSQA